MIRRLPLLALPLLLAACTTPTQPTQSSQLQTLYDYRLSSEGDADLTLEQAIARTADADIILVGELHSHPAVHLLQSRLLSGLYTAGQQHGRPLALSMEQFSRADQKTLDAYLANQIGEAALIREGNAWPNYPSDYRPLVEFAKAHRMPVIAANAPKPLVSCVGQEGAEWLDKLPASRRSQLARQLTLGDDPYRQKFMASMHHGDADSNARRFAAQTSWDDTMAESMVDYLAKHPVSRSCISPAISTSRGGLGSPVASPAAILPSRWRWSCPAQMRPLLQIPQPMCR